MSSGFGTCYTFMHQPAESLASWLNRAVQHAKRKTSYQELFLDITCKISADIKFNVNQQSTEAAARSQ